ncbi:Flagellar FliJ protein [Paraliobacillus sp. PM-2]|uniref:flagellar export protein FliJ n=1 Tax=Paraliobacillus sp. PM-2 TaxID=1462524 RepID=UPI00061B8F90|nr:flagellar export protein FliJ [Paraliobacillus sp. PM-2]CQR47698.1 Flagellar FliJ protein [Paraliobacillus sp. PM-2]
MAGIQAFQKILFHQERLKKTAQMEYRQSVDQFETIATRLYQLLKKKEEVEVQYNYYLQSTGTVTTLATHHAYIDEIKNKINEMQVQVNQARTQMEEKQANLTNAHIEVKKFEKIIEKKQLDEKNIALYKEAKQLDETSMRQFLMNEIR